MENVIIQQLAQIIAAFGLSPTAQIRILEAVMASIRAVPVVAVTLDDLIKLDTEPRMELLKTLSTESLHDLFKQIYPGGHPEWLGDVDVRAFVTAGAAKLREQRAL